MKSGPLSGLNSAKVCGIQSGTCAETELLPLSKVKIHGLLVTKVFPNDATVNQSHYCDTSTAPFLTNRFIIEQITYASNSFLIDQSKKDRFSKFACTSPAWCFCLTIVQSDLVFFFSGSKRFANQIRFTLSERYWGSC